MSDRLGALKTREASRNCDQRLPIRKPTDASITHEAIINQGSG